MEERTMLRQDRLTDFGRKTILEQNSIIIRKHKNWVFDWVFLVQLTAIYLNENKLTLNRYFKALMVKWVLATKNNQPISTKCKFYALNIINDASNCVLNHHSKFIFSFQLIYLTLLLLITGTFRINWITFCINLFCLMHLQKGRTSLIENYCTSFIFQHFRALTSISILIL